MAARVRLGCPFSRVRVARRAAGRAPGCHPSRVALASKSRAGERAGRGMKGLATTVSPPLFRPPSAFPVAARPGGGLDLADAGERLASRCLPRCGFGRLRGVRLPL